MRRSDLRSVFVILGTAVLVFMLAGTAHAATLTKSGDSLTYSAAAGENNNLLMQQVGTNIQFTDSAGVTITPAAPCSLVVANVAVCPAIGIGSVTGFLNNLNDTGTYDSSFPVNFGSITIQGGDGDDTLTAGGATAASFAGNDGMDTLTGNAGDDDLRGGIGPDTIAGGGGSDFLDDGPGIDVVRGGPGNDGFNYEDTDGGADILDGGPGLGDRLDARGRTNPIRLRLNGLPDDGEAGEGDNVINMESLDSGEGSDLITGSSGPEFVQGNGGNDVVNGGGGPDNIGGGPGNDVIDGGAGGDVVQGAKGADRISGGEGDDIFFGEFFDDGADTYAGGPGSDSLVDVGDFFGRAVTIDLDGNADDGPTVPVAGIPRDNAGADMENLSLTVPGEGGSDFSSFSNDTLTGNDAANEIDGGFGNDTISGLGGADTLEGGPGDDRMDGGAGVDEIDGSGGNDAIRSRDAGPDDVGCGSATDTLIADAVDEVPVTCDLASGGPKLARTSAKLKKSRATVRVVCPAAEGVDCKVRVTATRGKKVLASGSGTVKSGSTGPVRLKVKKAARRSRRRTLKARTVFTDAQGAVVTTVVPKLVLKR